MRDVTKNILRQWCNVFGRKIIKGLPYTFQVTTLPIPIILVTGNDVPLIVKETYYYGGVEHNTNFTENTPNTENPSNIYYADTGTDITLELVQGEILALNVYGEWIFDNR